MNLKMWLRQGFCDLRTIESYRDVTAASDVLGSAFIAGETEVQSQRKREHHGGADELAAEPLVVGRDHFPMRISPPIASRAQ